MINRNDILKDHQKVLCELLSEFDKICKKHGIKYMLFAGSMLGAVRHKGIIPWDDDLDIVMTRENYNRFLKVAPVEIDSDVYFLQKEFSEHWPMFFSKLRKNNTACIERYIPRDTETHQGVYIDIFPMDNLSDNRVMRKLQFFASKVVIAKSLWQRGYLTDSFSKKVFIFLCRFMPKGLFSKIVRAEKNTGTSMVHAFFAASSKYDKSVFLREWFEETVDMEFEGLMYPVPAHYDKILTCLYGDYMTPLPESQRGCKVHGDIIDLENSYKKYIGVQKNMVYEEYSRSIR